MVLASARTASPRRASADRSAGPKRTSPRGPSPAEPARKPRGPRDHLLFEAIPFVKGVARVTPVEVLEDVSRDGLLRMAPPDWVLRRAPAEALQAVPPVSPTVAPPR